MSPLSTGGSLPASPRVLGVVGLGLIGTSVALAARRRWPDLQTIGIDRPAVLLERKVASTLDIAAPDLTALHTADIIVLATPVDVICATLPQVANVAAQTSLILDTGSTKREVMTAARHAGVRGFVGGHPMAGAASAGADLARADLFDHRTWFLVEGLDASLMTSAEAFVQGLGARTLRVEAEMHDKVMAAVSQLPQVVASVLMTMVADAAGAEGLAWSGSGLRDTTRLASSPPEMWASLLASNVDYVAPLVLDMSERLRALAAHLRDSGEIERVFRDAASARALLDAVTPVEARSAKAELPK